MKKHDLHAVRSLSVHFSKSKRPSQTNLSLPLIANDWLKWKSMKFHVVTQLSWKSMLFTMKCHGCPCTFMDFHSQFRLGSNNSTCITHTGTQTHVETHVQTGPILYLRWLTLERCIMNIPKWSKLVMFHYILKERNEFSSLQPNRGYTNTKAWLQISLNKGPPLHTFISCS